jgi:hypothetical protein
MIPTTTSHPTFTKNTYFIPGFFLRLCRAIANLTRHEGVFRVIGLPKKYAKVSQNMDVCQKNGTAINSHAFRKTFLYPMFNRECMDAMQAIQAKFIKVILSK